MMIDRFRPRIPDLARLVGVAACVLPGAASYGQVIRGKAVEFRSDLPVAHAVVTLLDENRGETRVAVSTDSIGRYSIAVPASGRYIVRLHHTGYDDFVSLPTKVGSTDTVTVDLWPQANADLLDSILKTVKPTGDPTRTPEGKAFERRLNLGLGHVLLRGGIAGQGYRDMEEVITRSFDGVQVRRSRGDLSSVCYRGCCNFTVYRNGARSFTMNATQTSILQLQSVLSTRAANLYAIEFYVGQTEMPPEYFGETPSACGVLGYWTRAPG